MLPKQILKIVLYGLGLGSVAAMVYLAGPMIAIGNYRPLENNIVRQIVILLLVAAFAAFAGFKFWERKKASKALAAGVTQEDQKDNDEAVLKDKLKDALATLKAASSGKKDYLYDLPWYLLIGPPGSGKTTALVNSGLKFPLSRGATPAAIAGVGGTRYCDWWFTEDAVLIDTAGRYTTQDSDAKLDKQSWLAFLDLLKKTRPRQPINGVMVAISLEDIMTLSAVELAAHANAIRARLLELHERLKVDFPVYALFTKGDLVAGFVEYFRFLGDNGRKQVWGATFQTADKTRNLVGEVPVEFDLLLERLSEEQLDRLQDEPAPDTRVVLLGFPAQMARLRQPLFDFLNQIFEPTRYHANATLRGFYFTSGTQQGTPIDRLIGSLAEIFRAEQVAPAAYSGKGKSFFLHDLILKVIIGEAAWVSTDAAAVRRAMIMKACALAAIALITFNATLLWLVSYKRNTLLIEQAAVSAKQYEDEAGNLGYLQETLIADNNYSKILPLLDLLRDLPQGYSSRTTPAPWSETWGLGQHERLRSASETLYHNGLERMFRSRMMFRLEEQLRANINNAPFVYDALKPYMMLAGLHPSDVGLVTGWMRRDLESLYPGSGNALARKQLEQHLAALLDLADQPLVEPDGRLITDAQKTLARLSVAQRAYAMLKSKALASNTGDWTAAREGGAYVEDVFEAPGGLDSVRVPEFFTYGGFQRGLIERLGDIEQQIRAESWVLGDAAQDPALATQFDRLRDQVLDFYTRDFVTAWDGALAKLRLRKLLADKPRYAALTGLGAPTSPLKKLIASIDAETRVTQERQPAQGSGSTARPTPTPLRPRGGAPGAAIEEHFKPFHDALESGGRSSAVDDIVVILNQIGNSVITLATEPAETARANIALQEQLSRLRNSAARLPSPFSDLLLRQAVAEFQRAGREATYSQLAEILRSEVNQACERVANLYPFKAGGRDAPVRDFQTVFAPRGVMDSFFKQFLKPLVDTSKSPWVPKPGESLSPETLRSFEVAAYISDVFFENGNSLSARFWIQPPVTPNLKVTFESGGVQIESPTAQGSTPARKAFDWQPGQSDITKISYAYLAGGDPVEISKTGPWSFFRFWEASGNLRVNDAGTAKARFAGQIFDLEYQITSSSVHNPLYLGQLREFRCPLGI
jgi:type VI secretion system protein ImpL